jgi:hypothetical protein
MHTHQDMLSWMVFMNFSSILKKLITFLLVGQGYGKRTEAAEVAALSDRHLVTIDPRTFAIIRRSPTW